jgi:hypothetical protein
MSERHCSQDDGAGILDRMDEATGRLEVAAGPAEP